LWWQRMDEETTVDQDYLGMVLDILNDGEDCEDRTGTGTKSLFGYVIDYDASPDNFPLMLHKRLNWHGIVTELLWFLRGETNTEFLHKHGVKFWDKWADDNGELGPIYGHQLRIEGSDQIRTLIARLVADPMSRRHVISTWNQSQLEKMRLPPCHGIMSQFSFSYAGDVRTLSMMTHQRSADTGLGLPFNIASYALLLNIIAKEVEFHSGIETNAGRVIYTIGDAHVYNNHVVPMIDCIERWNANDEMFALYPKLTLPRPGWLSAWDTTDAMLPSDFVISDYFPMPHFKMEVSV
jgi:thymidylate synthase